MIITIDGPVASGKSTVAKLLADRLGFYCVNTGLLYRAVAYVLQTYRGVTSFDQLATLNSEVFSFIHDITYTIQNGEPRVSYKGEDITPFLKLPQFDQPASLVSANPIVRERLLGVQRTLGQMYDIIADGRDCGSVVYPQAEYKFFLTAPIEVRAARMAEYFENKTGQRHDVAELCEHIAERDKRDAERAVAPLRVPKGAIVIDNATMDIDQTVEKILWYVKN